MSESPNTLPAQNAPKSKEPQQAGMDSTVSNVVSFLTNVPRQSIVYRFLVMVASVVVIGYGVSMASRIIGPLFLALFLAITLLVPLHWMQRKGCPKVIALIIVIFFTIIVFVGISYNVAKSLNYLVAKTPEYKAKIEEKIATIDKRLERIGIAISGLTLWQQSIEKNNENTEGTENTNNPDNPVNGENKPDQNSPVDGENVLDNDFDNSEKIVPPPKNDTPTNTKTEPLPQNQPSKPTDQKPIVDIKSTDDNTNINTPNNRNNNSDNDGTDKNPSNELAKETNIETDKNQNKEPAEGNADDVAASDTTTDTDKVDEAEEAGIVAGAVENDGDNNGGKIETSSLGEFLGGNKVGFGFLKNDTAGLHTETERISAHNTKAKEKSQLILLNSQDVMVWLRTSLVAIREIGESAFLVLIFTIFMIFEAASFPSKVDRALGFDGPINNQHLQKIAGEIRRYLFLKAISSMMSAVAATAVYWFFGVPAMFFWGVVAFFLYFIPNVGGIIASIIPGLLIFMTHDWQGVVIYMICLVGIECTIGYGIEPKMLGHGLGISTVVILLSLFTWGMLLGPIGLFMAAPLTIMVKITLQAFKETEWLATLIDRK